MFIRLLWTFALLALPCIAAAEMTCEPPNRIFPATITRVDSPLTWTIIVDVDLGFGVIRKDAKVVLPWLVPVTGDQLRAVRGALEQKLVGQHVELCTIGIASDDGAYSAVIYQNGESVFRWIIETGLGKRAVPRNSF